MKQLRHLFYITIILLCNLSSWDCRSCLTFAIPPVTLTGPKTAAERQIVGEEKYIEKNTWLVASARTISEDDEEWKKLSEEEKEERRQIAIRIFRALRTIEFFDRLTLKYRNESVIGETKEGNIAILIDIEKDLPPAFGKQTLQELKERYKDPKRRASLDEYTKKMNAAREDLRQNAIESLEPGLSAIEKKNQVAKIEDSIRKKFKAELGQGHWYQETDGQWRQMKTDDLFQF